MDLAFPADPVVTVEDAGASFADVYAAEYGRVVRLLVATTGDLGAAEDIAQDAFAAAERRWARVGGLESPGGWIRRVALNRSVSRFRRLGRETRALTRVGARRAPGPPPSVGEHQHVWAAVGTLPARQRQVIALVYVEDRSVAQTAAVLGCGEDTVRTHLRRAKARLAELLEEDER